MSVINIVIPPLHPRRFSGGILCVFQYAKGLRARGHDVKILPLLPSGPPRWFHGDYGVLVTEPAAQSTRGSGDRQRLRGAAIQRIRDFTADLGTRAARLFHHEVQRGFQMRFIRSIVGPADFTLATSAETALPVHLYGSGHRAYFMQHFEPYFAADMPDPRWAEFDARESYRLGLHMIANSSWLQAKIANEFQVEPDLCPNAIDHEVFKGEPKTGALGQEIRIISYGGSQATWKGFREMAASVRMLREAMPQRKLRWLVFGDCLLPARNDIAEYEHLGFLQPPDLAAAYRSADILLSASWYESFPLFPLEAMACGLPVITTQLGTENYAVHERTAEIVAPRDVPSIARGLRRLIEDDAYRQALAVEGHKMSCKFTWAASARRMEELLLAGAAASKARSGP